MGCFLRLTCTQDALQHELYLAPVAFQTAHIYWDVCKEFSTPLLTMTEGLFYKPQNVTNFTCFGHHISKASIKFNRKRSTAGTKKILKDLAPFLYKVIGLTRLLLICKMAAEG